MVFGVGLNYFSKKLQRDAWCVGQWGIYNTGFKEWWWNVILSVSSFKVVRQFVWLFPAQNKNDIMSFDMSCMRLFYFLSGLKEFWYDLKLNILLLPSLWTLLLASGVITLYFNWTFTELSSRLESWLGKSAILCIKEMCFDYRGRAYSSFILLIPNVQNVQYIKT